MSGHYCLDLGGGAERIRTNNDDECLDHKFFNYLLFVKKKTKFVCNCSFSIEGLSTTIDDMLLQFAIGALVITHDPDVNLGQVSIHIHHSTITLSTQRKIFPNFFFGIQ